MGHFCTILVQKNTKLAKKSLNIGSFYTIMVEKTQKWRKNRKILAIFTLFRSKKHKTGEKIAKYWKFLHYYGRKNTKMAKKSQTIGYFYTISVLKQQKLPKIW